MSSVMFTAVSGASPLHLGQLHAVEALLVAAVAFGPFAALAVVVVLRRGRPSEDAAELPDR